MGVDPLRSSTATMDMQPGSMPCCRSSATTASASEVRSQTATTTFSEGTDTPPKPSTAGAIFDGSLVLVGQAVKSAWAWKVGTFSDTLSLFGAPGRFFVPYPANREDADRGITL